KLCECYTALRQGTQLSFLNERTSPHLYFESLRSHASLSAIYRTSPYSAYDSFRIPYSYLPALHRLDTYRRLAFRMLPPLLSDSLDTVRLSVWNFQKLRR